jgi:hypothetical protein
MRNILIVLCMFFIVGCGDSSSSTPPASNGGIEITCMDIDSTYIEECDATREESRSAFQAGHKKPLPAVVFNAGNVAKKRALIGNMIISNNSSSIFNGAIIAPMIINGCGYMGYIAGEIWAPVANSIDIGYGGSSCDSAEYGPNEYTALVYNGVIDMDVFHVDWSTWDWGVVNSDMASYGLEPFMRGTVRYNYVP